MQQQYHLIQHLSPIGYNWCLKVRVTRLWDAINIKDGSFLGIEMILLDSNVSILNFQSFLNNLNLFLLESNLQQCIHINGYIYDIFVE